MRVMVAKEKNGYRKVLVVAGRRAHLPPRMFKYVGRKGYGQELAEAVDVVDRAEKAGDHVGTDA